MNSSKLVDEDEPLFDSLINDLFPNMDLTKLGHPTLEEAIEETLEEENLIAHPPWIVKIVQLFETQKVRHGIMVIGPCGAGKTSCISMLAKALSRVEEMPVKEVKLNPKAITDGQMFGKMDAATNDWSDGIFSALWRKTMKFKKFVWWLTLDGPVDPNWIENLNSVLDDNKILTLANGDRLQMLPNMKLIIECENVDVASPATVSRCGMVYMSSSGLDWKPMLASWLKQRKMSSRREQLFTQLFEDSFDDVRKFSVVNLKYVMKVLQVHVLHTVFALMESLLPRDPENFELEAQARPGQDVPCKKTMNKKEEETEISPEESLQFEQIYIFSLLWSIGGYLENADRLLLQNFMRTSTKLSMPSLGEQDMFDYYFDCQDSQWRHWSSLMQDYTPPDISPQAYGNLLVPNVSSLRINFLIDLVSTLGDNVLLVGVQGSAKTTLINNYLKKFSPAELTVMYRNFSSTTTPQIFQKSIEGNVDKRMGNIFGPQIGKKLTMFVDDVNIPEINHWGDQPTNELFRSVIEMKGFYSLEKPGEFYQLADTQFMAAMIHPGGGTNDIPHRLKRHFVTFNSTIPTPDGIDHIFGTLALGHFNQNRGFRPEVTSLIQKLVPLTRIIWNQTKEKMLPTPAKFHYIFNLRDLSRMWLGMIGTQPNVITTEDMTVKLWRHEITRVIADRFISDLDKDWFDTELLLVVRAELGPEYEAMARDGQYFVDFLRDAPEPTGEEEGDTTDMELPKIYEPIANLVSLEERLVYFLDQYNDILRGSNMDLVFFPDAMINMIKISRIIRNPGGNALLVGVGGSGKQSLTKLASFIAGFKTFQITLTRTYNTTNFLEDLKLLFKSCGIQGKGTTFLFTDQDIKEESFLEYVNNVLGGGQILNLFTRDEQSEIINECLPIMKRESSVPLTPENAAAWFLERVHINFHVVLCFSPIGEQFRSRALKFPSLISGCTINWFQPWPKNALVAVANHFLKDFRIVCTDEVKRSLYRVMALVQEDVSAACLTYFERFRHTNNVTPKSFLNFIKSYKDVYSSQEEMIDEKSERINQGLNKLHEASKAIEVLKKDLSKMEKVLQEASFRSEKVLSEIAQKAAEAEKIKETIKVSAEEAEVIVKEIEVERVRAEETLSLARPALDEAEAALNTIKQAHIASVRKLGRPPHLIMRVMDCVLLLFRRKLPPPRIDPGHPCFKPSWSEALKVLSNAHLLQDLLTFPKDTINDETIELLEPYLAMEDYNMLTANRVCSDVAGLLQWTRSMSVFFGVNKEVMPLKLNLAGEEARLDKANKELKSAENILRRKERAVERLQILYTNATKEKLKIAKQADNCRRKMEAATTLINGLQGERLRWTRQSGSLKEELNSLIGNTMLACAFLSYSGPFNQEYRTQLMSSWRGRLAGKEIPHTESLDIISMLVEPHETSAWALQGLPTDGLSLQNAAIVTKARSFPLLIDPQGQGKIWLKMKEQYSEIQISNLNHRYFRAHLEDSLSIGKPLLIEDVGEHLDPILDNLLEKNFIKQGKSLKVMLGDKEMDVVEGFYLYITTKLPNPVYSPEISARCAIIDFTVTIQGLEDQLLGRVIRTEKAELELERVRLVEEIIESKNTITELEENLLEKLNSIEGSIVEDEDLIKVLQKTKSTSLDVSKKLEVSEVTNSKIVAAREEYRAVAVRGSVLYFLIVEMSQVNSMYQTSLKQFLAVFDESIAKSKVDKKIGRRIVNILEYLTNSTFTYTMRSLYEKDKFVFTLLMALKIDLNAGNISYQEFSIFLKGGASLNLKSVKAMGREKEWRQWCDSDCPEEDPMPGVMDSKLTSFQRLLMIRSCCPDRTLAQARNYVQQALGSFALEEVFLSLERLVEEADCETPLVCLLSTGSDPCSQIETMARNRMQEFRQISMGQGQEDLARRMITESIVNGYWLMLQNCQLCLEFCEEVMQTLIDTQDIHYQFRLWMTTEVHKDFPIGLLQMSIKFTNEPPSGVKSSLRRTFGDLQQDSLDYSNNPAWPALLYGVAFLHAVVQERRKFGTIGWNNPYEFNRADFYSSTQFIMNHLDDLEPKRGISWDTICYMLSEIQYGGKITDDFDRRLLKCFCSLWFSERMEDAEFQFFPNYPVPNCKTQEEYLSFLSNLPQLDPPEVFGLHKNTSISYQIDKVTGILDQIIRIQPKENTGVSQGGTREDVVGKIADEMIRKLPRDYGPHEVREAIEKMGGAQPMNIFLKQEISRIQKVLTLVKKTLGNLKLALEGTIVMNDELKSTLDQMFDARVPTKWLKISWHSSTLGFWFTELLERDLQFKKWCFNGKPRVFWMTGFFNPQGFITAMRQEVTRNHKSWSLDSVVCQNLVTRFTKEDIHDSPPEGVYIHGLFLEGASLDKKTGRLVEARPKILYEPVPVIYIYAINSTSGKDSRLYECPIYRKPGRTEHNYIGTIDFESDVGSRHWVMRGVALLCDIK